MLGCNCYKNREEKEKEASVMNSPKNLLENYYRLLRRKRIKPTHYSDPTPAREKKREKKNAQT